MNTEIDTLRHFWRWLVTTTWVKKALCLLVMLAVIDRAWQVYRFSPRLSLLILVISECVTLFLLLFSRDSKREDGSMIPVVFALGGSFFLLVANLDSGQALVRKEYAEGLQLVGLSLSLSAKFFIGLRFGLIPANRGIVSGGPYRLVRHPIYLGYLLTHIGFLLSCYTSRNLLLIVVVYSFQIGRIIFEERLLGLEPAYAAYMEKVRWRLVPFLF